MRKGLIAASLGLLAAAVIVTSALAKSEAAATPAQLASCTNVSLGFLGPLTGPAGVPRPGADLVAPLRGAEVQQGERDAVQGRRGRHRSSRRRSRARSRGVSSPTARSWRSSARPRARPCESSGNLFEKADLAAVSGSATAVDLTKGRPYTTFFRVNPNDAHPGARRSWRSSRGNLKAKNVVVIDSQDDYSVPLASGVSRGLRARNVDGRSRVRLGGRHRLLVDRRERRERRQRRRLRDAGRVGGEHALATSSASRARRRSCSAPTARTRRRSSSRGPGTCRSSRRISTSTRRPVRSSASTTGTRRTSRSAPSARPTYMAGLVAMNAITKACADGHGDASRGDAGCVRRTNIPSIFGGTVRFSRAGDPLPTRFAIYKITNGNYSPVG